MRTGDRESARGESHSPVHCCGFPHRVRRAGEFETPRELRRQARAEPRGVRFARKVQRRSRLRLLSKRVYATSKPELPFTDHFSTEICASRLFSVQTYSSTS